MNRADRESLRRISTAAFGQSYRLELMLVIAADRSRLVTLTGLAEELLTSPSTLQGAMTSLVETGLLEPVASEPGDRWKRYRVMESAAWDWAQELAERATASPPEPAPRKPNYKPTVRRRP